LGSKQKLLLILTGLFLVFFVLMICNIAFNFREHGLKSAEERAKLTAEIVKGGLTAHMVNGFMDQRAYFLHQIENVENINSIWLARSETVIKQFGEGFNNEIPRDKLDHDVMKSGVMGKEVTETATKSSLRVTIPFIASAFGTPNCLQCHEAKEGEVLGVLSMTIDISDIRSAAIITVLFNAAIAIITMILFLLVINYFFKPYVNIFYSIKDVMQKAYHGDYSARVDGGHFKESKDVANMLNSMLEKLQDVLEEIDKKVYIFLKNHGQEKHADPLLNINDTIDDLSDIYKFKQTIENDEEIEEVYERIAQVFRDRFKLSDFVFIEANLLNKSNKVVYSETGNCHCGVVDGVCRANRINAVVDSTIFDNLCPLFNEKGIEYLCIPFSISHEMNLIVSVATKEPDETERVRKLIPNIESYITTARPALVSRKLTQILKEMARVDQLTGMYNRKYLDEFADKMIPQALRTETTYGILMLDIDFFKMINDTYGHDVGDEAIRTISKVIKGNIRKSDIAVRFGGEEFIVLLHNCKPEEIVTIAEDIRTAFSKEKISAGAETFSKTLSVGTSNFPGDSDSIWRCIKYADIALYEAKETGRNKVVSFSEKLLEEKNMKGGY